MNEKLEKILKEAKKNSASSRKDMADRMEEERQEELRRVK